MSNIELMNAIWNGTVSFCLGGILVELFYIYKELRNIRVMKKDIIELTNKEDDNDG